MIHRRHFCLGTAALLVAPRIHASPWPARPIRLIVAYAAGGTMRRPQSDSSRRNQRWPVEWWLRSCQSW